jgi:hypothetical protein
MKGSAKIVYLKMDPRDEKGWEPCNTLIRLYIYHDKRCNFFVRTYINYNKLAI